jgi:hypothetical protein
MTRTPTRAGTPQSPRPPRLKRAFGSLAVVTTMVAASLLVASPANAADVVFTDPGLRACVNQSLGQPATASVSTAQAAGITQLYCSGIASLDGIQALTSLWDLTITGGPLSELAPLTGMTKLTQINISNDQIADLGPLASLTNLVYLSAGGNSYSDLTPISGLTQLKSLDVSRNQVTDLTPLAGLSQLSGLVMNANTVSDLAPLAGLTNLAALYASDNDIVDLTPLSGLTKIFQLFLDGNDISDVAPLSTIAALDNVRLQGNHITDLSPLGGLPLLAQVFAQDQTVTLPAVTVGQSTANPLRLPHGETQTAVWGDSGNFVLAADGASWSFSSSASNTVSWDMAYPGPIWPAWNFSGTFLQRSTSDIDVLRTTTLVDDTATTPNTQPVTIDVLANDGLPGEPLVDATTLTLLDADGDPTTQLTVTGGVFTLSNGTVVFTPTAGFAGAVADVSYQVTNTDGVSGKATIRVTVTASSTPQPSPQPTVTPTVTPTGGTGSGSGTAASGGLASTGFDAGPLGLAALLASLLGLGVVSILAFRRRRTDAVASDDIS